MERRINERMLKERVQKKMRVSGQDVKRKTMSCKNRERYNRNFKQAIDY